MHVINPNPKLHGPQGYAEVIQSVEWGITSLGHQATYGINAAAKNAINIVFGAQLLPVEYLQSLPSETIIYNFEQMRGLHLEDIRTEIKIVANRFRVWDYSSSNLAAWERLGRNNVTIVPIGYAPVLTRIEKSPQQDIDVLIYGSSGELRLKCFHQLASAGLVVMFVSGIYGKARDDLIARAKLVLNANVYKHSKIFELVRVSYLLANKVAVVGVIDDEVFLEAGLEESCIFTPEDMVLETCDTYIQSAELRLKAEERGFDAFAKRSVMDYLRKALESLP
jgi:hypothetical protein